tara:strand:+ start:64 stop:924 length:861 start_codon:yes stop_codon:yes gene_type:complete
MKKTMALDSGCNVSFEYIAEGDVGDYIPDYKVHEAFPDDKKTAEAVIEAITQSPLEEIDMDDGKIKMEFEFTLAVECYKDDSREDRCRKGKGCKNRIEMDFNFWVDVDYMFPPSKGRDEFVECLNSWTPDSKCVANNIDYLKEIAEGIKSGGKSGPESAGFEAFLEGKVPGWVGTIMDGAGAGVPGGLWDAIGTIADTLKVWDVLKLIDLCGCPPDAAFTVTDHQANVQAAIDGPQGKGREWEDIIAHYVRSYWDAYTTGDTDYITNIESYDEILVLAAAARSRGL